MKYRRKVSVVEAFRWMDQLSIEFPEWLQKQVEAGRVWKNGLALSVETDTGPARCNHGDWIVQAEDGRVWPAANDFFAANYEVIEE